MLLKVYVKQVHENPDPGKRKDSRKSWAVRLGGGGVEEARGQSTMQGKARQCQISKAKRQLTVRQQARPESPWED